MSKQPTWATLNPPVEIEAEHVRSRAKRTLLITVRWGNKIEGNWGNGAGVVVFDLRTGYGASGARDWRITLGSARALTGDAGYLFSAPTHDKQGHVKVYAKSRQPDAQLSLFDIQLSHADSVQNRTPSAPDKELQRKSHAYLMREGACCEVKS